MADHSYGKVYAVIAEEKTEILNEMRIQDALSFSREVTTTNSPDIKLFTLRSMAYDMASEVIDRVLSKLQSI